MPEKIKTELLLRSQDLRKSYRRRKVLQGVTFSVYYLDRRIYAFRVNAQKYAV